MTRVTPLGSAKEAGMEENDIVTHIAGQQIANDGTVPFRKEERLDMRCVKKKAEVVEKLFDGGGCGRG